MVAGEMGLGVGVRMHACKHSGQNAADQIAVPWVWFSKPCRAGALQKQLNIIM
jgi:hypothetical protein